MADGIWSPEFTPHAWAAAGHQGVFIFALKLAEQELTGSLFGWSVSPHDLKIPKQRYRLSGRSKSSSF